MDAPTGRPAPPDTGRIHVRLADVGELAASLPQLLGFHPRESVVLVALTGADGSRVGLTVRADIPPPQHAASLAADLADRVRTGRPAGVVLAVVSEAPDGDGLPHRDLVHDVVLAMTACAIPVREAVLVRAGRRWSYDCPDACCAPGGGIPLPGGVTELEVAAVATGVVVEPDRTALAARIAPGDRLARSSMASACAQVAVRCAEAVLDRGWDAVAAQSWAAVLGALARCRPGAAVRLTDSEVARVVWGLRDRTVRDRALELALGQDAPATEQLWTECTRRAPAPLDAAPATLLAVSSWLRGDGAMAGIALDRALAAEPGYALARLLSQALDACVPPGDLRRLIRSAVAAADH